MAPIASTYMASPGFAGELELQLIMVYSNSLALSRDSLGML
jgi:hypothetical protein